MAKQYYECNDCKHKFRGNVSKNKPTLSIVRKCPKCGKIAWLEDEK